MIEKLLAKVHLFLLLRALKQAKQMPPFIEIGKIGPYFVVNVFSQKNVGSEFIVGNVSTGMSLITEVAWLKGINEWIERKAFLENKVRTPARFIRESDGCAAYSHFLKGKSAAKKMARSNALNEAIERFVWSKWWDSSSSADIEVLDRNSSYMKTIIATVDSKIEPENLYVIAPKFRGYSDRKVIILFLSLKNGGFISGGACGLKDHESLILERAIVELLRHSLGYCRMIESSVGIVTFYDQRLYFFASGRGDDLVWLRINSKSNEAIEFSKIEFDSVLEHTLQGVSTVYHIQFEEPPYFLEGPLERLCL